MSPHQHKQQPEERKHTRTEKKTQDQTADVSENDKRDNRGGTRRKGEGAQKSRGGAVAAAVMMAFVNERDFLCGVNRYAGNLAVKPTAYRPPNSVCVPQLV